MPGVWQDMSQLQKTASFQEHVPVSEKRPWANGRRRRRRVWLRVSIVCRISHFRSPNTEWWVLCYFIRTRTAPCDLKLILVHKLNIPDWKNVVAQKYKPWMMRPQVFMGICSLAKQIQSSFDKSLHCHEILVRMQVPRVLSARHAVNAVVFFCLPRKFLCPVLWFSSVRLWYAFQHRWSCEPIATKSGNRLTFFGCIVTKSLTTK